MRKPKKSSAGNKRCHKVNGQARPKTEHNIRKEGPDRLSVNKANPCEPASSHFPARRKAPRDENERKRELWERKHAELEARWVAAQSRQTGEETARKRKMRLTYSITFTVLGVLLCALTWYFAQGSINITTPA
jgi:hypothetical protein